MDEEVTGIITAISAVIGFIGFMVSRWSETNPDKPWYVRLAKVCDVSQIFDSTRKLND